MLLQPPIDRFHLARMPPSMLSRAVCLLGLAVAAGCAPWKDAHSVHRSPLAQPRMAPDSVVLDVYWVRVPLADMERDADLWSQIDEQSIDAAARRTLVENGFRMGIVGVQPPLALQRLLEMTAKESAPGMESTVTPDQELKVTHSRLQVRGGKRGEIVASPPRERFTLLLRDEDQLQGRTFTNGQGVLSLRVVPQGDGRLRLRLVPELHHGQPRQKWSGEEEMFVLETARSREVLEMLALQATLSPGQMLLVTTQPGKPGSLGHQFFTQREKDVEEQRLLLIRLSQTQRDDLFAPEEAPDALARVP
jgi:hypothetical protein